MVSISSLCLAMAIKAVYARMDECRLWLLLLKVIARIRLEHGCASKVAFIKVAKRTDTVLYSIIGFAEILCCNVKRLLVAFSRCTLGKQRIVVARPVEVVVR